MKRILLAAAGLAFVLTLVQPAPAQDLASSIVGTWKMTSWARKEVATGKSSISPFGERPVGYSHYTRGGRFMIFFVAQDRKVNEKPELTEAESLEFFKTLVSYVGTYKVESGKVIQEVEGAYIQSWAGTKRIQQTELAGNKLTLSSAPFKSRRDGQDIVVVTTWERVE